MWSVCDILKKIKTFVTFCVPLKLKSVTVGRGFHWEIADVKRIKLDYLYF